MKNWLTYQRGFWINGVKWEPEGFTTLDPNAVIAVSDAAMKHPETCCLIMLSSHETICVMKSRTEVIADIQSALP